VKIQLSRNPQGLYYELIPVDNEGNPVDGLESVCIETDWNFPGTASNFGFVPCDCGATDGTVDCPHKTASEMISAAQDFLDEHDGDIVDDPGYFSEDES
jgi:hypothetical protein